MIQSAVSLTINLERTNMDAYSTWCLVTAEGRDSGPFLHKQLSNIALDLNTQIVLHAYCTPQGRVHNNLFLWIDTTGTYHMLMPRPLRDSFITRLRQFILRDQVRLTARDDVQIAYITASHHYPLHQVTFDGDTTLLAWQPQAYLMITAAPLPGICHQEIAFQQMLIEQGWPLIQSACLQAQYTPHVLCFDRIQAISFDKGCYPGQEIVARTHYRGKVKKHAVSMRTDQQIRAPIGAAVYSDEKEVGTVINAVCQADSQLMHIVLPDDHVSEHMMLRIAGESYDCQPLHLSSQP